jgi:TolB-like protein/Tfp pilus assembly protein PilF
VVRLKAADQMSPYEALLRSFGYNQRFTPEDLAEVRTCLERAVQQAPGNADCWAMLSLMYANEYGHWDNAGPDSLGRALRAARTAVEAAPLNSLPYYALAQALFFQREIPAFRVAAERAVSLNPMDGATAAFMGLLIAYAGDWERGCALSDKGSQLNPNHPGWYRYTAWHDAYRKKDYRRALDVALRLNAPQNYYTHAVLAICYAQLGQMEEARKALRDMLALKPNYAQVARELHGRWIDPDLVEQLMDGLRKAGLEIGDKGGASAAVKASGSGAVRAEEGFWVAVLPFKYSGADAELTALAEGLSEEIVTGLSRFSYLRVIARSSTSRYANESVDVRSAGKELGARYVMEGSLRQAGTKLRLAVQLVDAASGAHLWAENFERAFSPEAVFELQDDLVPRIVSTVADMYGVLTRSMSEALRGKADEELSPHEAVLRAFGYMERVTPEEHARVRGILERVVRIAPNQSDAWAMLANLYWEEHAHGLNPQPDPLGRALAAARRAVEAAPSNNLAHYALASTLFFQKDFPAFRSAAERAIELNRMDASVAAFIGNLIAYSGDWERGVAVVESAMQLNPRHPGWYWFVSFNNAYRQHDYRGALGFALKFNQPGNFYTHAVIAQTYGQLGMREEARKALQELLALRPDFAKTAREEYGRWFHDLAFIEHQLDGLRKAGLDVPALSGAGPVSAPPDPVAIAVLPFSDLSPGKDQEYLCEGMAEEIMNALVRIDGIRIASRTSAFRARQGNGDLASIARALSVNHVLEGSVRTAGGRLRVTAQLTDVASGFQLWSERFDRDAADVFAVQDEIAAGVVDAVKARLAPGSRAVQHRAQVHNLEAYRSYLKGRHLRGVEDYGGALRAFEEAVQLDPAHAPSWTGLAEITVLSAHMGMIPPRAACAAARKALVTAKKLQGESAEGFHVEAFAAFLERRWDAMETAWRRALELQPDHVLALGSFAISLCARQRLDEALPLFERAREADPLASFPYMLAGWGLLVSGRPEEGLRHLEDALTFEKEDASAIAASCMANVALGRLDEAIAAGEHGVAVAHRAPFFLGVLGWALAAAGRKDEARKVLEELRARPAGSPTAVSEAWLLGALGQIDDAFDVLSRAEEEHQGLLCYTGVPGFDPLRSDPRFGALLERLGLPSSPAR